MSIKGFGYVQQSFFPDSTTPQFTVDYWIRNTEADLARIEEYFVGSEKTGGESGYAGLASVLRA